MPCPMNENDVENEEFIKDTNELRHIEGTVRGINSKLQLMIHSSPLAIIIVNKAGIVDCWNPAAERIFGWSEEEVLGQRLPSVPENKLEKHRTLIKSLKQGEVFSNLELKGRTKRGEIIDIEMSATALKDAEGNINSFMALISQITDPKRIEKTLKRSDEDFRTIFDNASDAIYICDTEGRFLEVNKVACDHLGRTYNELLTMTPMDIVPSEIALQVRKRIDDVLADGQRIFETVQMHRDGTIITVEINARTIDYKGKKAILAIARDVSKRKQAEEQLKVYSEHLEELVEDRTRKLQDAKRLAAIGETAIMIGHDLRNPLQAVVTTTYLAKAKVDNLPFSEWLSLNKLGLVEDLRTIEKQSEYMNKIVSDLQDYARPLSPKLIKSNIKSFVKDVLSGMRIPENVEINVNIEDNLEWVVDHYLAERVLINLAANAIQAMPRGGRLSIAAIQRGNTIVLTLKDTGIGIPAEILPNVFEPLVTTKPKGMGMGLAVCKRFVETMGGKIGIKSETDIGTEVTIEIPII